MLVFKRKMCFRNDKETFGTKIKMKEIECLECEGTGIIPDGLGSCLVCNTEILKTKVNGRGTYYCPSCQKEL